MSHATIAERIEELHDKKYELDTLIPLIDRISSLKDQIISINWEIGELKKDRKRMLEIDGAEEEDVTDQIRRRKEQLEEQQPSLQNQLSQAIQERNTIRKRTGGCKLLCRMGWHRYPRPRTWHCTPRGNDLGHYHCRYCGEKLY